MIKKTGDDIKINDLGSVSEGEDSLKEITCVNVLNKLELEENKTLDKNVNDLTNTTINNFYPISSGIEDYATNLLLILSKNTQIISYFNYILAIEGLSAAQAIDLGQVKQLGVGSQQLYSQFRTLVPFLEKDSNLSELVEKIASELIANTLGIATSFGAAQL